MKGIGIRTYFDYLHFGQVTAPEKRYIGSIFKSYVGAAKVQLIVTGPVEHGGDLQTGRLATAGYDGHAQAVVDLVDARITLRKPVCPFLSADTATSRHVNVAVATTLKDLP